MHTISMLVKSSEIALKHIQNRSTLHFVQIIRANVCKSSEFNQAQHQHTHALEQKKKMRSKSQTFFPSRNAAHNQIVVELLV